MSTSFSRPPSPASCPRCARAIPAHAALGACPHCLLAAGFASEPAAPTDTSPPPSPAELTPDFPELEIIELIGRGGMGAVYKARQRSLDRIVALKLLRPGLDADPSFAERFTREARALAQLNHTGIVTLYEFGRTPSGRFFILMEFVDGLNLRQLLAAGRIAPREALAIIPPLCDALQYAHDRGLVHRDIKPENILVDRLGRVKVADFGLAKLTAPSALSAPASETTPTANSLHASFELTEAGKVMGTPRYMAPEQRDHPDSVDHRADIYALGVVLYQMLTGELPDAQKLQPPSQRVQLDVRLDEIVLRALASSPSLRYAAASELKTQIEHVTRPIANSTPSAAAAVSAQPASPATHRTFLLAAVLFVFLYVLHLLWALTSADELPAKVASHFGMDGHADGYMSKNGYRTFICLFPLVLGLLFQASALFIRHLPDALINIPHRDVWLSATRRPELIALLQRWFAALACGLVIFSAQLHTLTLLANRLQPPRLPNIALFTLIGFPAVLLLWVIGILLHLAEPEAAAKLHTRRSLILAITSAALLGFFAAPAISAWVSCEKTPATALSREPAEPTPVKNESPSHQTEPSETLKTPSIPPDILQPHFEQAQRILEQARANIPQLPLVSTAPASPPPNPYPTTSSLSTPRLQFREVLPAPTATTESLSLIQGGHSETLPLSRQVLMDEKAVSSIAELHDVSGNGLLLRLSPSGTQQFTDITRALVGKRLAILFDGRVLIAPFIRDPITDGVVQISGRFSMEEVSALTKSLRDAITNPAPPQTPPPPPDVEIRLQDNGTCLIDSRILSLDQLNEHFAALSRLPTPPLLHIKVSNNADRRHLVTLMEMARKNNLNRLKLSTL